ncbi:MAG: hypothetical protein U0792_06440 [Gemmataceae bacterium]
MTRRIFPAVLIFGFASFGFSEDTKSDKPKADPKDTPLELTIIGKTTKYTLDTGGMSLVDYKKSIEAAAKAKGFAKLPAAPAVDLTVEVKNTSDKPVKVWIKGDPVVLTLELKGNGAVNADFHGPMTLEFRLPEPIELAPGKSQSFPVKSLRSGMRGVSKFAYWTEPGDYELVATLRTGMTTS